MEIELKYLADKEAFDLRQQRIAVRARYENDNLVATVKWGGGTRAGLHIRGEYNVVVDESFAAEPDLSALKDCEVYDQLVQLMEGRELIPVMEMYFVRAQVQLDTGKSTSIISYDEGMIRSGGRIAPISEIELELTDGDTDDMLKLGEKLAKRFGLQPEDKSKFKRGLELQLM